MARRHCQYRVRFHNYQAKRVPDQFPPTSHSESRSRLLNTFDSVVILGSATPVASRVGHLGGIINFVLE
jgi:hypothetical protein